MTSEQLASVNKIDSFMKEYLTKMARKYVVKHACRGISLCASALEHDGYVHAASSEATGSDNAAVEANAASGEPDTSAVTKEYLEEALMPAQLYEHGLWESLRMDFTEWEAQVQTAVKVMCALLSKTKAWTLIEPVSYTHLTLPTKRIV